MYNEEQKQNKTKNTHTEHELYSLSSRCELRESFENSPIEWEKFLIIEQALETQLCI